MHSFQLGDKAKDESTEFEGTITAIAQYLGGSTRIQLSSHTDKEGKLREEWFDEGRLVPVE